jgi:membrane-associated phospholipid phosphatase
MLQRNCISIALIGFLSVSGARVFAEGSQDLQAQTEAQTPAQEVTPRETANSESTVKRILQNFGEDQKAIWTSPFHIKHDNAKWWVIFGLGTAALIGTDRSTEGAIPHSLSQTRYSTDVSQIGEEYVTLPIAGGLYLFGRTRNDPKAREVGVLGAQALLDSEILVTVLKLASGRERPNVVGGNGRFFHGQGFNSGFPSGHAIESWTFASVISHEYATSRVIPIVAYGLAATVSAARFTGQFHYASDIVAGGAMGWFVGRYVWNHHQDPAIHKRYGTVSRLLPNDVSPMVRPGTRTRGVHLAWIK